MLELHRVKGHILRFLAHKLSVREADIAIHTVIGEPSLRERGGRHCLREMRWGRGNGPLGGPSLARHSGHCSFRGPLTRPVYSINGTRVLTKPAAGSTTPPCRCRPGHSTAEGTVEVVPDEPRCEAGCNLSVQNWCNVPMQATATLRRSCRYRRVISKGSATHGNGKPGRCWRQPDPDCQMIYPRSATF